MHIMVQMFNLTRREFERNLAGLTDEDARKHIGPMNCISWIVAHVGCQVRSYFVDWPAGRETDARYLPYGYGALASEPPLEDAVTLYRDACREADAWLQAATDENLREVCKNPLAGGENWGALLARCIFHSWCHLGEISSIRQILGHKPPQFVDMYGWKYGGE